MKKVQLLQMCESNARKEKLLVRKQGIFSTLGTEAVRKAEREYINLLMCIKA